MTLIDRAEQMFQVNENFFKEKEGIFTEAITEKLEDHCDRLGVIGPAGFGKTHSIFNYLTSEDNSSKKMLYFGLDHDSSSKNPFIIKTFNNTRKYGKNTLTNAFNDSEIIFYDDISYLIKYDYIKNGINQLMKHDDSLKVKILSDNSFSVKIQCYDGPIEVKADDIIKSDKFGNSFGYYNKALMCGKVSGAKMVFGVQSAHDLEIISETLNNSILDNSTFEGDTLSLNTPSVRSKVPNVVSSIIGGNVDGYGIDFLKNIVGESSFSARFLVRFRNLINEDFELTKNSIYNTAFNNYTTDYILINDIINSGKISLNDFLRLKETYKTYNPIIHKSLQEKGIINFDYEPTKQDFIKSDFSSRYKILKENLDNLTKLYNQSTKFLHDDVKYVDEFITEILNNKSLTLPEPNGNLLNRRLPAGMDNLLSNNRFKDYCNRISTFLLHKDLMKFHNLRWIIQQSINNYLEPEFLNNIISLKLLANNSKLQNYLSDNYNHEFTSFKETWKKETNTYTSSIKKVGNSLLNILDSKDFENEDNLTFFRNNLSRLVRSVES